MNEETKQKLSELFEGWEPVELDDPGEINFNKPLKGKYVAEIKEVRNRKVETKNGTKNIIGFKIQVVEDISGDASNNRYLDKDFWMGASQFDQESGEESGIKQMINSLYTAGLDFDITSKSDYDVVAIDLNRSLEGKTISVRAYPSKNTNDKTGEKYQAVVFCKPHDKEDDVAQGNPFV